MNKKDIINITRLTNAGFTPYEAQTLRRAAAGLYRWFKEKRGLGYCVIQRDNNGKPFRVSDSGMKFPIRDMEKSHMKRIDNIMSRYPKLSYYIQENSNGATLYIGVELNSRNFSSNYIAYF